ncbi:MAG: hypothetical protein LUQ29_10685, partial [Methylococcaceae bacterium]|nr:hypothetical protein [Methylococcaceae bacterium]
LSSGPLWNGWHYHLVRRHKTSPATFADIRTPAQGHFRLKILGVCDSEIDNFLDIIRQRIANKQNGCQWQRHYINRQNHDFTELTRTYLKNQNSGNPVSDWMFA